MLENLLEKYNNRYNVTNYGEIFNKKIVFSKENLKIYFTSLTNPKPFLDGAIFGSVAGLGVSIYSGENYAINTFVTGTGLGLISQQQYYFMLLMEQYFGIFSKSK